MAAVITILFITSLTILGELHAPTKDWLQTTFTHHWIGKSILAVVVYGLVTGVQYFLPKTKLHVLALSGVALSCAIILLIMFYYGTVFDEATG